MIKSLPVNLIKNRNYIKLLTVQSLVGVSDGVWRVALLAIVVKSGGNAVELSSVFLAAVVPGIILRIIGGVWSDSWRPESLVQWTQILRGLLSLLVFLILLNFSIGTPLLFVANFIFAGLSSLGDPAYNSLLPQFVDEEDLPQGNALFSTGDSLAFSIAPALAGAWLIFSSATSLFIFVSLTLAIMALLTRSLEISDRTEEIEDSSQKKSFADDIKEGWGWIKEQNGATAFLACFTVINLLMPIGIVALPIYAQEFNNPAAYGWLLSATGLGALVGSLVLSAKPIYRVGLGTAVALFATGIFGHIIIGLTHNIYIALLLMVLNDAFLIVPGVLFYSWIQSKAPSNIIGRVFGLSGAISYALVPMGYVIAPMVLEPLGVRLTFIIIGILLVLPAIVVLSLPSFRKMEFASQSA